LRSTGDLGVGQVFGDDVKALPLGSPEALKSMVFKIFTILLLYGPITVFSWSNFLVSMVTEVW